MQYKATIDQVRAMGHEHTLAYSSAGDVLDDKLATIDASYSALQATSVQIQDRLSDIRAMWTQYEELVEECDNYVTGDVRPWLQQQEMEKAADTFEHAQLRSAVAKVSTCL